MIDGIDLEGLEYVSFNGSKWHDISKMTADQVAALFAENNVNFDSDWLDNNAKDEYWTVDSYKNTYNRSLGTKIKKYASKASLHSPNSQPYFSEWDRTFTEWLYAYDEKLDGPKGVWNGVTLALSTVGVVLSGGTLLAAEGTFATFTAAGGLLLSIDELTAMPGENTILENLVEQAGGEKALALFKGAKLWISVKNATKGLIDVSVALADGKQITGVWDAVNSVFSTVQGVEDVKKAAEEMQQKTGTATGTGTGTGSCEEEGGN